MKSFSPFEKLAIITEVLNKGASVYSVCRKYKISKVSFYKWLSKYKGKRNSRLAALENRVAKGKNHYKSLDYTQEQRVLRLVHKNPNYSCHKIAKILGIGHHGVQNILEKRVLSRVYQRNEFARKPFWKRESKDRRVGMMNLYEQGWKVKDICAHYKISKPTFSKWRKRYEQGGAREEVLGDCFISGSDHHKSIDEATKRQVLSAVIQNPDYSVHKLHLVLAQTVGHHGIQNILAREGLNTYARRQAYAEGFVAKPKVVVAPQYVPEVPLYRLRQILAPFVTVPKLWVTNPLRGLLVTAVASLTILLFALWVKLIVVSPGSSRPGLVFATVALLFGTFFFLYSMKYYLTILMILRFATQGERKTGKQDKVSPLGINFDRVKLDSEKLPFVSIHVALYNEKRVVERLIQACASQAYSKQQTAESSHSGKPLANYEVVLVDDSTDETTEIAKETLIDNGWKLSSSDVIASPSTALRINSAKQSQEGIAASSLDELGTPRNDSVEEGTNQEVFVFTPLRQGSEGQAKPVVKLIHRSSRSGFKGGALQKALENTNERAQYIMVLDADFVPYADMVEQFVKTFQVLNANEDANVNTANASEYSHQLASQNSPANSHSNIAAVQGYQWHVLNKSQTWVTRGVRTEYAGSYVIERSGAELYGGLKQIAGSVYAIRADVLRKFGWGTSITEDFQLTLRLYEAGYKVAFTPYIQVPAEAVSTIKRLIRQRMRWAEGASFNVKLMLGRMLFGRWEEQKGVILANEVRPESGSWTSPSASLRASQDDSKRKVWAPSRLTLAEKLEFLYLAPYYLQAAFFVAGTMAWFFSEAIFHVRLPFWTAALGWSLVLTNLLSLPLMNIIGLFLEESDEKDYAGIFAFIALSYIMVPFQAYAAVKGFLEKAEGPWFRTPKTGVITDTFGRSGFNKFFGNIFGTRTPSSVIANGFDKLTVNSVKQSNFEIATAAERPRNDNRGLALAPISAFNDFNRNLRIRPRRLRLAGRSVLVALLLFAISLNIVSFNQNGFFGEGIQRYIGADQQVQITGKDIFKADEKPQFGLKIPKDKETRLSSLIRKALTLGEVRASAPTVSASLVDAKGEAKDVSSSLSGDNDDFELALSASDNFKPGKYTLKVEVKDAKGKFVDEAKQDFRWGVLAINVNKSIYTQGETVKLGIGMVDDVGKTVCNAKLTLEVKKPDLQVDTLSSEQDQIQQSGQCGGSSVTNVADNLAEYQVKQVGTYSLHLKAVTENGPREIDDRFEVRESVPFDIERTSYPTRIYPPTDYPVKLTIVANEDFEGEVVETVPASFEISNVPPSGHSGVATTTIGSQTSTTTGDSIAASSTTLQNDKKIITWDVDWKKGSKHTLGYTIKFPRESPQFYLVGPLSLRGSGSAGDEAIFEIATGSANPRNDGEIVFQESRQWQIAADVVATKFMETPDATNFTTGDHGIQFWNGESLTGITYDTSQKKSGRGSWKADSGAGNALAYLQKSGVASVGASQGSRITAYFRLNDLPGGTTTIIKAGFDAIGDPFVQVRITSGGVLQLWNNSAQIGTDGSTLSAGTTWYRLCLTYILNASTRVTDVKLFKNGTQDISVTGLSINPGLQGPVYIGWVNTPGVSKVLNFQHVYVDDSTALTDTGDIRVTAKLPNTAVHTSFDTTGGSGAVNERPISETNYKQHAATTQVHQDYDIETAAGGDVNISGNTLVALSFWVWAKDGSGANGTPKMVYQADTEVAVSLASTADVFTQIVDTATYPSAGASVIGMESTGAGADTFFYEGGVMVASLGDPVPELALALAPLSFVVPKIIKSIQKGTLVEDLRSVLRRLFEMIKKTFAISKNTKVRRDGRSIIKKSMRRRKKKKDG